MHKLWLWILVNILICVLMFNACFPKEYNREWLEFSHGSISAEGFYDPDAEHTVCTTERIKCTKFRLERDFSDDYIVKVYYFNDSDQITGIEEMVTSQMDVTYPDMPEGSTYIRIVLEDPEEGFSDWDLFKLRFSIKLSVSTKKNFWDDWVVRD